VESINQNITIVARYAGVKLAGVLKLNIKYISMSFLIKNIIPTFHNIFLKQATHMPN
jgi:hypothetical protein